MWHRKNGHGHGNLGFFPPKKGRDHLNQTFDLTPPFWMNEWVHLKMMFLPRPEFWGLFSGEAD